MGRWEVRRDRHYSVIAKKTKKNKSQQISVNWKKGDAKTKAWCEHSAWESLSCCVYVHAPAHEKATVVLLSPEQAVLRLPKFPLANNNSPKVPIEARRAGDPPGARRGRVGAKGSCVWLWRARKI